MMKLINLNKIAKGVAIAAVCAMSTQSWGVALDTPLPYYDKAGNPSILFTDIAVEYKPGQSKKRSGTGDSGFTARSTSTSVFTWRFYDNPDVVFTGATLTLDASITPKGDIRNGWFEIKSTDPMFNFGTTQQCNKQGKACQTVPLAGTVLSGDLLAFGWSGTQGFLEFETGNLYGWAADMANATGFSEHIYFNVGAFDLNDATAVTSWKGMGDGMAIVPVPAAAWLLGSGLLGLVGIARRRRNS